MEHSKQAHDSNETEPSLYSSVLPYLDVMEHAVKRMAEVLYAKAYFRALYDEAFAKVMTEIGGAMMNIEHLSHDPTAQIGLIRNFIRSTSFAARLDAKLPLKQSKPKSCDRKI